MEKLIELLNEYGKVIGKSEYYEWEKSVCGPFHLFVRDIYDEHHIYSETADTYAISKKYGFVKWLVENDKIDFSNLDYMINIKAPKRELYYTKAGFHTEALLMLLSIQDEPIEFLCSLLK